MSENFEPAAPRRAVEPSQTAYPWQAALRTAMQVGLTLATIMPIVLLILGEEYGELLPAEIAPYLVTATAIAIATTTALARIMAIPAVNTWLTSLGLGAEPKSD